MKLLEALNNVYSKFPKTRKYMAEIITEICSKENVPVNQVFFVFWSLIKGCFRFQCFIR